MKIGDMIKFDNSKMIHSLNKKLKGHLTEEINERLKNRKYKILMGDLCEDGKMLEESEWKSTLKIGILNTKIEENLKIYQEMFDIVLTDEDANLNILNEIIFQSSKNKQNNIIYNHTYC